MPRRDLRRDRTEAGQATLMIVGFAFVLAMGVALVVDASAAYLQRQGLDTVADGAARRGAARGAPGPGGVTRGGAAGRRGGPPPAAAGAGRGGPDLGATGREVYTGGVPADRLELTAGAVRASVHDYLVSSGAYASYPGLSFTVAVDPGSSSVTVHVRAPLDLPLTVPGSPGVATIAASGSAVVVAER